MKALLRTVDSFGPTILRLVLGGIMLAHGLGKVFPIEALGGHGLAGTVAYFHNALGVPVPIAYVGALAEFVGGALLVLGALARVGALLIAGQMAAAAYLGGHLEAGFFANWFRKTVIDAEGKVAAAPEGWEFHLAMIGMALALVLLGAGKLSVDAKISGAAPGDGGK